MWTTYTSMSKHFLLISLCVFTSFNLPVIAEMITLNGSSTFNLTQDVYNYCPLTSFKSREIKNLSLPDGKIPCCGDCLTTPDCGYKQPCCFDTNIDSTVKSNCKYPVYIGNGSIRWSKNILINKPKTLAMWMVDSCATDNANTLLETKCKTIHPNTLDDFTDIIPVIDTTTSIIYLNRHCAACNGIQEKNINTTFYQVHFQCEKRTLNAFLASSAPSRVDLLNENNCVYVFRETVPALVSKSVCYTPIEVNKCNQTGRWRLFDPYIVSACDSYTLPFYDNAITKAFKNIHCYICNYNLKDNVYIYLQPTEPTCSLFGGRRGPTAHGPTYSFYALLNTDRELYSPRVEPNCPVMHFYDPNQDHCRNYTCPVLSEMTDRGCVEIFSSYNELYWSVSIALSLDSYSTTENISSEILATELIQHMKSALIGDNVTNLSKTCFEEVYMSDNNNIDFNNTVVVANFGWQSSKTVTILSMDVIEFLKKYEGDNKNLTINIGNAVLTFRATLLDIRKKFGIEFNPRFITRPEITVYNKTLRLKHRYYTADDSYCFYCMTASKVIPCERVMLNENEYDSIDDGMVRLVTNERVLSETEYIIHTGERMGKVTICVDDYLYQQNSHIINKELVKTAYTHIAVYASFICSLLSISGLVVVLLTFSLFKELRTLPGVINMFLCSSLLIAQTLQQFAMGSVELQELCIFFGILIHFFWLKSLFWMNVSSFNIFMVFSSFNLKLPFCVESYLVWFYALYAVLGSLLFIVLNTVLSLSVSNWNNIGYGGNVCYISSSENILYTFSIPVGILVTFNVVFLLCTIWGIHRVMTPGEQVQNHRNNALIYMKLSTLTGTCWVFGFLRLWTGQLVFEYLFILLNATQGLFLMISFVCNRRVYNMYRQLFLGKAVTSTQPITSIQTSETDILKSKNASKKEH